jgi:hypothetical protein
VGRKSLFSKAPPPVADNTGQGRTIGLVPQVGVPIIDYAVDLIWKFDTIASTDTVRYTVGLKTDPSSIPTLSRLAQFPHSFMHV